MKVAKNACLDLVTYCISTLAWKIEEIHPNFNDYLLAILFDIYFMPPPSPPQGGSQWSSK
jgi:hypothetical protein